MLFFWLSNLLLKRLEKIHFCVSRIEEGHLNKVIPDLGNDEIGLLAKGINNMREYLLDLRDNMEKKAQDRTKKLKANQAHLEITNTQLIEKQQRLEAAMMRISLATNTGNIGIWEYDTVSGVLHWDERMFKLYGVLPENFNNTYDIWEQYVHPEDLEQSRIDLNKAIETSTPLDTEFRILWPNGEIRYIKAKANFLYNSEKKPALMIGVNYDLTELKQQKEALVVEKENVEAALSKIEAIFSATSDVIIAIDDVGIIKSANQSITSMFNYSIQEVLGKNIKMLMPEKYKFAHDSYLENYKKTGERHIIGNPRILRAQRKDGSSFPIELIVNETEIKNETLFTGIIRDISEQVKIKKNLQRKEALLSSAIHSSSAGFVIEGSKGEIIEVNDSICNWLGYEKEELLRLKMTSLLSADQQADQYDIVDKIFTGELTRIHQERKYICKDGSSVWGLLSAASVHNEYDEVIYLVMHIIDINQEKLLTEKLNTRNKALEKSNEDLDQFAYIASHDLKSPLNAIKQLATWISEDCQNLLPDESKNHLSLLKSRTKRMENLLDDLLLYSRAERYNYIGETIN